MKKLHYLIAWLVFAVSAWIMACSEKNNTNATELEKNAAEGAANDRKSQPAGISLTDSQHRVAGIKLDTVSRKKLSGSFRLVGEVMPSPAGFESVLVPVGGVVKTIQVKPGDQVSKGQALFTLGGSSIVEWQEQYLESAQQVKLMQSNWERDKQLFEKKAISERQWQETQSQYKIAVVKHQAYKAKLLMLGIAESSMISGNIQTTVSMRSPVAGTVEKVMLHQGEFANPEAVVVRIAKPSAQQWVLRVMPQDADRLAPGNRANCEFLNGTKAESKIISVASELSENNLVNIYVQPLAISGWVPRFGSSFSAEVFTDNQTNWVLPESAIIESDGKKYCFIERKPGEYSAKEIEVLGKSKGFWILKSNMAGKIVVEGAYWIWMQMNQSEE